MKRDKTFKREKKPAGWLLYTCTIITVNNVQIMTHDDDNMLLPTTACRAILRYLYIISQSTAPHGF